MAWEVRDVRPSVKRVAEAAADAEGKPLETWISDTVRAAVLAELGKLPELLRAAERTAGGTATPLEPRGTARPRLGFLARSAPARPRETAAPASDAAHITIPTRPVVLLPVTALRSGGRTRHAGPRTMPAALLRSIAAEGVRVPILVRRAAGTADAYEVIAGERRRFAAERAGQADVPAVMVEADDAEALLLSLAENLERADFSPIDEARTYLRLLSEYRIAPTVLASRLGRERAHLALTLRLLGLPPRVREHLDSGRLNRADALALLDARDPEAAAQRLLRGPAPGAGASEG